MWWGAHHGCGAGFHPFVLFPFACLFLIILTIAVFRIIVFRRYRRFGPGCWGPPGGPMQGSGDGPMEGSWRQGPDIEAILRRRLAAGEITEAEYDRLRDLLKE